MEINQREKYFLLAGLNELIEVNKRREKYGYIPNDQQRKMDDLLDKLFDKINSIEVAGWKQTNEI